MASLLNKLKKEESRVNREPKGLPSALMIHNFGYGKRLRDKLFRDHPSPEDRIENIKRYVTG